MQLNCIRRLRFRVRPALSVAVVGCLVAAGWAPVRADAVYFIVRHAEKAGEPESDPPLSEKGKRRAEDLKRVLRSIKIDAVFSTGFNRTNQTVEQVAKPRDLVVSEIPIHATAKFVKILRARYKDQTVLIAGHSNTVPELIKQLGVPEEQVPEVTEKDYDNLFIVTVSEEGQASLTHLHYGEADEESD